MNLWLRLLIVAFLAGPCSFKANAQSSALKPVITDVGRMRVTVGCDTAQSFDRYNLTLLQEQAGNEESLIDALIGDMRNNGASKANVKATKKEQKEWVAARDKQCETEASSVGSQDREVMRWSCREWAARCRLQEVMHTHDRIVPTKP